jgi:dipeptidyl aminopeptidase/acylaminoacyl peptidase
MQLSTASAMAEPGAVIPLEAFFENPTISEPRLSPNGKHIAFIFSDNDSQRLFVRGVVGTKSVGLVEFPMREVRLLSVRWANAVRLLLSGTVSDPNAPDGEPEMTRLYSIDRKRQRLKYLGERWGNRGPAWPTWQARYEDKIINLLPSDSRNVLISHLEFGQRTPTVSRLNITSGRLRTRLSAGQGIGEWYADRDGNVRVAEATGHPGGGGSYSLLARTRVDRELKSVFRSDGSRGARYRFVGFHEAPYLLYVIADHEGRDALFEFDIEEGSLGNLVFAHPEFDVTGAHYNEALKKIVGANFTADEPEIAFFDAAAEKEQLSIDRSMRKVKGKKTVNRIISATADGNLTIVEVSNQTQPPIYFAYDRSKKEMNLVFEQRPVLPVDRLAEVARINFAARDAAMIPGYLTRPRNSGSEKLPMIVIPHDGPSARDSMVYNPVVQFFANRGYAVLQVNYRGSRGFGREFQRAGYIDWGRGIRDDITDGVKWAIAVGIADPERIGIFGTGYGGYAALMGLLTSPELYRAGASYAAPTDLEMLARGDGDFLWEMGMHREPLGETGPDRERLRQNSLLHRVDEFRVPVLLGHGTRDSRVAVAHARNLNAALEAAGKSVKYLEYGDEFQNFVLESSRIDFYTQLLSFFETNLGVGASSLEVPQASVVGDSKDASAVPAGGTQD